MGDIVDSIYEPIEKMKMRKTMDYIYTEMISKYGEQLVVMAVHSTAFANPSTGNNNVDFKTEYGEKWATDFGCTSLPTGIINRKKTRKFRQPKKMNSANWLNKWMNLATRKRLFTKHLLLKTNRFVS
jgi:hypothetical protein